MRVAVVASEYPPHVFGGLGVHVDCLTSALVAGDRQGEPGVAIEIELLVPARGDYRPSHPAVRLHEVAMPDSAGHHALWMAFCAAAVERAAHALPAVDLVHCHDWLTVPAGIELARRRGCPLVFNVHLPQARDPMLATENEGLVAADLVLVNSRSARRELAGRRLPIRRLEVVPNGVDLCRFYPDAGWPTDDGYVLFVGRLVPQKGVEVLLRAFAAVARRLPASRLVIAGDGEQRLYLRRLARHLGILDRVRFAGWCTGDDLAALYRRARVVAVPSCYEPFGIVALEAMACGRPVVASQVGGLAEVVVEGEQGLLVPMGDPWRLAARLVSLLTDADRRQRMGEAGVRRAGLFTWHRLARRTAELYGELQAPALASPAESCA